MNSTAKNAEITKETHWVFVLLGALGFWRFDFVRISFKSGLNEPDASAFRLIRSAAGR
jgi:hypothetical protein